MFDLRARIGLMVPSLNTALESEANLIKPSGVSFHAARMKIVATTEKGLADMAACAETAARDLSDIDPNCIIYGCTSGSFLKGRAWEKELTARLELAANTKVITTSGAIVQAISTLGKRKISIASPYIQEVNQMAVRFFSECGFEVCDIKGLDRSKKGEIRAVKYEDVYRLGRAVMTPETEVLLLSCTEMRSMRIIKQMEVDFGIPVISSNQCDIWAALRYCGIKDNLADYGSLFSY